ncbi:MAG: hypothetical protein LKM37_03320 [Bacteroidales bacterium]|jgi:hypothetical protein|nr:hypothetical protein [Bacteroidales bacterium]MCI1732773.1 hypothetical protein [Bacteroidales bacterium]
MKIKISILSKLFFISFFAFFLFNSSISYCQVSAKKEDSFLKISDRRLNDYLFRYLISHPSENYVNDGLKKDYIWKKEIVFGQNNKDYKIYQFGINQTHSGSLFILIDDVNLIVLNLNNLTNDMVIEWDFLKKHNVSEKDAWNYINYSTKSHLQESFYFPWRTQSDTIH